MWKSYIRWTFNILVAIAIVVLVAMGPGKTDPWVWHPYLIFALANWLFADLLFQYIPVEFSWKSRKIKLHMGFDLLIAVSMAILVFYYSSRYLFDDAGFVLRYVENIKHGYFYKFNPSDPPVFGLSGFIYGLSCFLFSVLGFSPTVCLKLSNLLGTIAYLFILLQICRHLIENKRIVWLVFIIMALGIDTIVLMFASGLELPVHIAIILVTIFFFLKKKHRLFLLFSVLSVISKLDAAPIMVVLWAMYAWEQVVLTRKLKNFLPMIFYAGIPLILWILFATLLFGSPLPQSAFAKYFYHPNPDKHSFPFLYYFFQHPIRKILGIAFEVMALLHLIEIVYYRKFKYVKLFAFGWMFIAIMTMYYYYNPNERMIWYYSLPDFLLMGQVLFSFSYWIHKKPWVGIPVLTCLPLLYFLLPVMKNMNGALTYHNFYTERVERERFMIGEYMHNNSTPNDTLMSSHGLVGWKFNGYVMDLSGLNSKLVTNYKRNVDSLIQNFRPHYIINHAWIHDLNTYGKYGFEMDTIFADVNLLDYPYWAIMKRTEYKKRGYAKLPMDACSNMYDVLTNTQVVRFYSDSLHIQLKDIPGNPSKLWAGVKREEASFTLEVTLWTVDNKVINRDLIYIEKGEPVYVSKYVKGISIPLQVNGARATAVTIVPIGIYSFSCFDPMIEFVYE